MLLLTDFKVYTSDAQYDPFVRHCEHLWQAYQLDVVLLPVDVAMLVASRWLNSFDLIGVKLSFRTSEDEANRVIKKLRRSAHPRTSIVYFDGDDDLCVQWSSVVDQVDAYVKKHSFVDPLEHTKDYLGRTNLTDYVRRLTGQLDDGASSRQPLTVEQCAKVRVGWNVGLDDHIQTVWRHNFQVYASSRQIDVSGRAMAASTDWIYSLRNPAYQVLIELESSYRSRPPRLRISSYEYEAEVANSKIVLSPFGYGEICWRDFETIAAGAVLVKPDMSHVLTYPEIYQPDYTYVPVEWDYSDAVLVISRLLSEPERACAISTAAQQVMRQAGTPEWFGEQVTRVLGPYLGR